jgi:hypothetical protein
MVHYYNRAKGPILIKNEKIINKLKKITPAIIMRKRQMCFSYKIDSVSLGSNSGRVEYSIAGINE